MNNLINRLKTLYYTYLRLNYISAEEQLIENFSELQINEEQRQENNDNRREPTIQELDAILDGVLYTLFNEEQRQENNDNRRELTIQELDAILDEVLYTLFNEEQSRENTQHLDTILERLKNAIIQLQQQIVPWCRRAAVPLATVLVADVIFAFEVFRQYFWLKQAPASLITAKVSIAIFEYVSYIGLCLFASRNITSRCNKSPIRSLFRERQGMHRVLVLQTIISVVVHAIAHSYYNNKEFSWPIGVTGEALLSIMVLGLPASYGIYALIEHYRNKYAQKGKFLAWLDKRLNYAKFEKTHKFLATSALVLYLSHIGLPLPGINEASWGVSPNVSIWSRLIAWGGAIMVGYDKFILSKRKTIYGIEPKTLTFQEKVLKDGSTKRVRIMRIDVPMSKYEALLTKPGANYHIVLGDKKEPHVYSAGISEEGKLSFIIKSVGPWSRKTTDLLAKDEEEPNNIPIHLSGPYYDGSLCSITDPDVDKAAIIVGGTGISFLNNYLSYQKDNGRCPLYLVIKQNCDDIKLVTETGTLQHILNLAHQYKKKYKGKYQNFIKIVIAISGNEENYKLSLDELDKKIQALKKKNKDLVNVDISIECTHCPREESDSFDAFLLKNIKKFLNPKNTKNHNPSIFFCGPPAWAPSLTEKAIKEECPFIAEIYGTKNSTINDNQTKPNAFNEKFENTNKKLNSKENDMDYKNLPNIPRGLSFVLTPRDGHCLYNAVALYLRLDVFDLRNLVADELKRDIDKYRPYFALTDRTIEDYIQNVRNTNEWAGDLEITILSTLLGRAIITIGPNGNITNRQALNEQLKGEPIFVYYNNVNHYDGLVLQEGYSGREMLNSLNTDNILYDVRRLFVQERFTEQQEREIEEQAAHHPKYDRPRSTSL